MKEIISASRRTDIPACYLDQLLYFIHQGYAEISNPYSGKTFSVDLRPQNVHTMVLWSKNFTHFLRKSEYFHQYHLYFLFTINDMPDLEPGIPVLSERLEQVHELAARYGPERIAWRYDPVVFTADGPVSTVETFEQIGEYLVKRGIRRVIFSFLDLYEKVKARNQKFRLRIIDPPAHIKIEYASQIADISKKLGISLESCSEMLDSIEGIIPGACINGKLLSKLAGEQANIARDPGQRSCCNCSISRDIGSYRGMPCFNGCLYCYANPVVVRTHNVSTLNGVS